MLIFLVLIIRFLFNDIFVIIKYYLLDEISLFKISYLYAFGYNKEIEAVNQYDAILVKSYQRINDTYYVEVLNNTIEFPFEGIVVSKNNDFIKIDVENNISFYISNFEYDVLLYEHLNPNQIIGFGNSYYIWSDNITNLDYLSYCVAYEEL